MRSWEVLGGHRKSSDSSPGSSRGMEFFAVPFTEGDDSCSAATGSLAPWCKPSSGKCNPGSTVAPDATGMKSQRSWQTSPPRACRPQTWDLVHDADTDRPAIAAGCLMRQIIPKYDANRMVTKQVSTTQNAPPIVRNARFRPPLRPDGLEGRSSSKQKQWHWPKFFVGRLSRWPGNAPEATLPNLGGSRSNEPLVVSTCPPGRHRPAFPGADPPGFLRGQEHVRQLCKLRHSREQRSPRHSG